MATAGARGSVTARPAYLDLAEPDLETLVGDLVAAGHRTAVVVPLLFTSAFHATVDVPEAVRAAAAAAGLELLVSEILGTGDDVAALLRRSLDNAGVGEDSAVVLFAVGSSQPAANAAVVDLATRLGQGRPRPVRAAFGTCEPRPAQVLADIDGPVAILPLFLAEGLLLDPMRRLAAEHGWVMAEPLGQRAADLVLQRYAAALAGAPA